MKSKEKHFIYTNRKHTKKGIISTILAVISFISLVVLLILAYAKEGVVSNSFGAVCVLCTLYSVVGIIVGVAGKYEQDKFYFFSHMGIIWNVVDLLILSGILYAGT